MAELPVPLNKTSLMVVLFCFVFNLLYCFVSQCSLILMFLHSCLQVLNLKELSDESGMIAVSEDDLGSPFASSPYR